MLTDSLIPNPSHRHAAPSAPWPWMDIDDAVDQTQLITELPPIPEDCDHNACGGRTEEQDLDAIYKYNTAKDCIIHHVDVNSKGLFENGILLDSWKRFMEGQSLKDVRIRALFVENLSGPPFFFSSSLNWIPSRYQEDVRPGVGDHITITMTFLRSLSKYYTVESSSISENTAVEMEYGDINSPLEHVIDTKAPLDISVKGHKRQLILDLLSVHLVRRKEGSIIISYHPSYDNIDTTEASYLQQRIYLAGRSVYWQNIFQHSPDPTFVLLMFVWHALYAWDEALENLYTHICSFENEVLTTINATSLNTQRLYKTRAHMLHYSSLLEDFRKTVEFIPKLSRIYMECECAKLLDEIARLEKERSMQDKRLKNVMSLVFSSVSITDSKHMQEMTEAAARDSAAMKQISYLTMLFLPASFVATVFGMNVIEISPDTNETLSHYFATAVPLTIATIWIIIAFQIRNILSEPVTFWKRVGWPIFLVMSFFNKDQYEVKEAILPLFNQDTAIRIKHV
ncbi:hypothetical protein BDQ17DRAFT_1370148 [Cyathus striatus]|nr:hypothetical protein BDQ17DRAFT_1370148 [Cyathus striatus]